MDQRLLADAGGPDRNRGVTGQYLIGCPDVVEVKLHGRPDHDGLKPVGPDGRIEMGAAGRVRVEGLTATEAAHQLADELGLAPERVAVRIADYRSQQVYLVGEVTGLQRAVPYRGPETVLDLLQRAGGITPGASVGEIYVLRAQVAEGRPPEVYHVDLKAIVERKDQETNLRLQPYDRVYVGETRKSCLAKCMPPCLRPLFKAVCGLTR
jgi:protein involved in polysaccharide export with SLBB domain